MLKFAGRGDDTSADIRIYGDGVAKEIYIDITKPPFDINFGGFYPKTIFVTNIANGMLKQVTMQNGTVHVLFDNAPVLAEFKDGITPPFTSFSVQFIYGSDITT